MTGYAREKSKRDALRGDINLEIEDGKNLVLGTSTGTKIGTSSSQKLGFFDTTPVTQQSHITDAPGDTSTNNATTINAILTALETFGLVASS